MGLDTSHDAWHGPYSSFQRWRREIAELAGLPPLDQMDGFCSGTGISWKGIKTPLVYLLNHSDCDGQISAKRCAKIADELEALLPKMKDLDTIEKTQQFIEGCRLAASKNEPLLFR